MLSCYGVLMLAGSRNARRDRTTRRVRVAQGLKEEEDPPALLNEHSARVELDSCSRPFEAGWGNLIESRREEQPVKITLTINLTLTLTESRREEQPVTIKR